MRPHKLLSLLRVLELPPPLLRHLLALVLHVQLVHREELAEGLEGVEFKVCGGGKLGAVDGGGKEGARDAVDRETEECGL